MKKLLALVLAGVMVMGLSVTAMAETQNFDSRVNGVNPPFEASKDVTVTIANKVTDPVYYVDVTWDSLEFTYTFDNGSQEWDPTTHIYTEKMELQVGLALMAIIQQTS